MVMTGQEMGTRNTLRNDSHMPRDRVWLVAPPTVHLHHRKRQEVSIGGRGVFSWLGCFV